MCWSFASCYVRKMSSLKLMTPDDSARNRKMRKMMSLNCSICLMPVLGLERHKEFGFPKAVLPSSACGCLSSFLPLWFHGFWRTFEAAGCVPSVMSQSQKQDCHTLQRVDLARPFLISLVTKIELKTASKWPCLKWKAVAHGNPIFGTVEPCDLLETQSSLHYASKSKLGLV